MSRQLDDVVLGSLELFCLAAETGSFTAAAAEAGVTPAAVSRSIARLEARLGIRLFVRTTRSIRLTDAGRRYHSQCRQALTLLNEAERDAAGQQQEPAGTIRLSMPTTYGHHRILPLLPLFRQRYPKVQIDLHIGNRNIDFVSEGYDLAIRVRAQPDSTLIARPLEDAPLVVVATPEYLQRAGTPQQLADLAQHDCIQFELPSTGRRIPWLFCDQGNVLEILTDGGYCLSEDVLGGVTLARNGAGLFQTYRFIVEQELASGQLVEVLSAFSGSTRPYTLLYAHNRHIPLRQQVFIDFLLEYREQWQRENRMATIRR